MSNSAIIKAKGNDNKAVYLHWNGGRDSVEAFLKYCELKGFRSFEDDYGMARFCQVVGNFFGADGLGLGIVDNPLNWGTDNGIYIIDGWKIVGREDFAGREQQEYDLQGMLIVIDEAQPKKQQLGEYLTAKKVPTSTLKIGDIVILKNYKGEVIRHKVVGFGTDKLVNGTKVLGIPYIDLYWNDGDYTNNPNNYLTDDFVRIVD